MCACCFMLCSGNEEQCNVLLQHSMLQWGDMGWVVRKKNAACLHFTQCTTTHLTVSWSEDIENFFMCCCTEPVLTYSYQRCSRQALTWASPTKNTLSFKSHYKMLWQNKVQRVSLHKDVGGLHLYTSPQTTLTKHCGVNRAHTVENFTCPCIDLYRSTHLSEEVWTSPESESKYLLTVIGKNDNIFSPACKNCTLKHKSHTF